MRRQNAVRRQLVDVGQTHQCKIDADFLLQDFQHAHHCGSAARGHRPGLEPADADRVRAERQRLQHIGAALDAAIDDDRCPPRHRLHDLRQHVQRRATLVQLAASVVRHVDHFHTEVARDGGIFGAGDALQDQWNCEPGLDAPDQVPGELRLRAEATAPDLRLLHLPPGRRNVALGDVPLPAAVNLRVDRQAERRVSRGDGAFDHIHQPGFVADRVQLVDLGHLVVTGERLEVRRAD